VRLRWLDRVGVSASTSQEICQAQIVPNSPDFQEIQTPEVKRTLVGMVLRRAM
jgi:hypothetical protein